MSSTIKDVASRAGVSTTTVSRVVNQNGYVSKQVKKKVLDAIQELNYSPSMMAINLAKNQMRTIGVIVPDICNSFFSEVFYAASRMAEKHKYRLILCNSDDNIEKEASALQDMISYRVSGIVIVPVSDEDGTNAELLESAQKMGIPSVFVDREMKNVNYDGVFVENVQASYNATELLLKEGHRKIAIIAGPQDNIPGRERLTGYKNAMNAWGVNPVPEHVVIADFKTEKSYHATLELIKSKNPPTAFFTCNNLMTLGCLRAIFSCGKKIPDDIALVGFDEIDFLDIFGHKISVVARATSEMGTVAMRLLLDMINNKEYVFHQRIILESHLKICGSEKLITALK